MSENNVMAGKYNREEEELASTINALLAIHLDGLKVTDLEKEYMEMEGCCEKPWIKFGFHSFHQYLSSIPHKVKMFNSNDKNSKCFGVTMDHQKNIQKLISQEKPKTMRRNRPGTYHGKSRAFIPRYDPLGRQKRNQYSGNTFKYRQQSASSYQPTNLIKSSPVPAQSPSVVKSQPDRYQQSTRPYQPENLVKSPPVRVQSHSSPVTKSQPHILQQSTSNKIEVADEYLLEPESSDFVKHWVETDGYHAKKVGDYVKPYKNVISGTMSHILDPELLNKLIQLLEKTGGVEKDQLERVYEDMYGEELCAYYSDYNCNRLMDFLRALPDVFRISDWPKKGGFLLTDARKEAPADLETYAARISQLLKDVRTIVRLKGKITKRRDALVLVSEELLVEYKKNIGKILDPKEYREQNLRNLLNVITSDVEDMKINNCDGKIEIFAFIDKPEEYVPYSKNFVAPSDVIPIENFNVPTEEKALNWFPVIVGDIHNPGNFYLLPFRTRKELDKFMAELGEFYNENDQRLIMKHFHVVKNAYCVTRYVEMDNHPWHRGRVMYMEGDKAQILFEDYGTFQKTPKKQLRYLLKKFADFPIQASNVEYYGIAPKNHTIAYKSDDPVIIRFANLVDCSEYTAMNVYAKIMDYKGHNGIARVRLMTKHYDKDGNEERIFRIHRTLVKEELVEKTEEFTDVELKNKGKEVKDTKVKLYTKKAKDEKSVTSCSHYSDTKENINIERKNVGLALALPQVRGMFDLHGNNNESKNETSTSNGNDKLCEWNDIGMLRPASQFENYMLDEEDEGWPSFKFASSLSPSPDCSRETSRRCSSIESSVRSKSIRSRNTSCLFGRSRTPSTSPDMHLNDFTIKLDRYKTLSSSRFVPASPDLSDHPLDRNDGIPLSPDDSYRMMGALSKFQNYHPDNFTQLPFVENGMPVRCQKPPPGFQLKKPPPGYQMKEPPPGYELKESSLTGSKSGIYSRRMELEKNAGNSSQSKDDDFCEKVRTVGGSIWQEMVESARKTLKIHEEFMKYINMEEKSSLNKLQVATSGSTPIQDFRENLYLEKKEVPNHSQQPVAYGPRPLSYLSEKTALAHRNISQVTTLESAPTPIQDLRVNLCLEQREGPNHSQHLVACDPHSVGYLSNHTSLSELSHAYNYPQVTSHDLSHGPSMSCCCKSPQFPIRPTLPSSIPQTPFAYSVRQFPLNLPQLSASYIKPTFVSLIVPQTPLHITNHSTRPILPLNRPQIPTSISRAYSSNNEERSLIFPSGDLTSAPPGLFLFREHQRTNF